MNYAIVYLAGILAISTAYWYARGHKYYTGPLIEAEIHEEDSQAERSSIDDVEKRTAQHGQIIG